MFECVDVYRSYLIHKVSTVMQQLEIVLICYDVLYKLLLLSYEEADEGVKPCYCNTAIGGNAIEGNAI